MNKDIYLDNFVKKSILTNSYVNSPQRAFGDVLEYCFLSDAHYARLNTGIICFRPSSYLQESPYGWKDLHKKIILSTVPENKREQHKLDTFDIECRYLLGIHKANLRTILKTNDFSRELTRQENSDFTQFVKDFLENFNKLFLKFGHNEYLDQVNRDIQNYGFNT